MEETLASQKMEEINLIYFLESIRSTIVELIQKLEGYIYNKFGQEKLGINIFKGLNKSTNDLIEMDLEKKFQNLVVGLLNFTLYKSLLIKTENNYISEIKNSLFSQ